MCPGFFCLNSTIDGRAFTEIQDPGRGVLGRWGKEEHPTVLAVLKFRCLLEIQVTGQLDM